MLASVYTAKSKKKFDKIEKFTHIILYKEIFIPFFSRFGDFPHCKGGNKRLRKSCEKGKEKFRKIQKRSFMGEREKTGKKLFCGAAVGAANSLFGGGGGMIAVPMLAKTGMTKKCAHATAILLILPISLLSFFLYAVRGLYDFSVMIPTAIGVSFGGAIGAKLLGKLPVKTVNLLFAFLQAAAGIFMLFFR